MADKYFTDGRLKAIEKFMMEKPENIKERGITSIPKDCRNCTDFCRIEYKCTLSKCKIRAECKGCEYREQGSMYCSICYKKIYNKNQR